MVTVVEGAADGTPGKRGVCGMSNGVAGVSGISIGLASWGVTGVMGGRPGVVGT
jgi:hypothetical protein